MWPKWNSSPVAAIVLVEKGAKTWQQQSQMFSCLANKAGHFHLIYFKMCRSTGAMVTVT